MAILMPINDCTPATPNGFLTPLYINVGGTSVFPSSFNYNTVQIATGIMFLRNEQLTNLIFPLGFRGDATYGKYFNISLTNFKTCTVTSANPAVVTITAHGYSTGDKVRFQASTIPTGMIQGLQYFVNVQSANTFWIYDTYANAIAGGTTGRVATTSTGSSVTCHKIIEEKSYTQTDVYGDIIKDTSGSRPLVYFHTTGWTTVVDTTASKWGLMLSTDDPTVTGTFLMTGTVSGHVLAYGTTTQSAVSDVDSFCFSKKVDLSAGYILKGYSILPSYYNQDPFLNPKFVFDPTKTPTGALRSRATSVVIGASFSSIMIGKNLMFTSELSNGDTSATLTTPFDGVSGTYKVQLLSEGEYTDNPQVSMTFVNGSTSVTFAAISGDYNNYAVVVIPLGGLTWTVDDLTATVSIPSDAIQHSIVFAAEKYYKKTWSNLDAGISVGANSLTTKHETGWQIGDKFQIGGNIVSAVSASDQTIYTITGISTSGGKDTISFSPNLATYDRAERGAVALNQATQQAITFVRTLGTSQNHININGAYAFLLLCNLELITVLMTFSSGVYIANSNSYAKRLYWLNCWAGSTAWFVGYAGATIKNVCTYRGGGSSGEPSQSIKPYTYIQDLLFLYHTFGPSCVRQKVKYDNIRLEGLLGSGSQHLNLNFYPSTEMRNLHIWCTNTNGNAVFGGMTGGLIENFYVDGAFRAIQFSTNINGIIRNVYFGTLRANTYDISPSGSAAWVDYEINNIVGSYTFDSSLQKYLLPTAKIRLTDINGIAGNNRVIQNSGETRMTGSGLADTTQHNNNPCMIFASAFADELIEWKQTIPTGNIQNKDMLIGIWCKISSASYWAGINEKPKLKVIFDKTSVLYVEAELTTDWQFISIPITPTTTTGYIELILSTLSDAGLNNSIVYWSDISVLYPAGYTLNLGVFNNTARGEPVTPTISTSVSAADVWAADPSQFGADTVGDKVNAIKRDTGLIGGLL